MGAICNKMLELKTQKILQPLTNNFEFLSTDICREIFLTKPKKDFWSLTLFLPLHVGVHKGLKTKPLLVGGANCPGNYCQSTTWLPTCTHFVLRTVFSSFFVEPIYFYRPEGMQKIIRCPLRREKHIRSSRESLGNTGKNTWMNHLSWWAIVGCIFCGYGAI